MSSMPSRKTPLITGEYYHVFNRTIGKRYIFLDRDFNSYFLQLVNYYKAENPPFRYSLYKRLSKIDQHTIMLKLKFGTQRVTILAYCLMPTHYHFLLQHNDQNGVSSFISNVLNVFIQYYNKRTSSHGPMFLPRFKAIHIDSDSVIKHVSRYIHLNPFSSGIVSDINKLEEYPWSSYKEYVKKCKETVCNTDFILDLFRNDRDLYKKFINERAGYQKSLERVKHLT